MVVSKRYKGFLIVEMSVSLIVLVIILATFSALMYGFTKFNRYNLVRQRCIAAAQAELDSITVTGETLSDEDFKRLWPELGVSIEQTDGKGQWQGLKLIKAKTQGQSFNWNVKVELARYILPAKENQQPLTKRQTQNGVGGKNVD